VGQKPGSGKEVLGTEAVWLIAGLRKQYFYGTDRVAVESDSVREDSRAVWAGRRRLGRVRMSEAAMGSIGKINGWLLQRREKQNSDDTKQLAMEWEPVQKGFLGTHVWVRGRRLGVEQKTGSVHEGTGHKCCLIGGCASERRVTRHRPSGYERGAGEREAGSRGPSMNLGNMNRMGWVTKPKAAMRITGKRLFGLWLTFRSVVFSHLGPMCAKRMPKECRPTGLDPNSLCALGVKVCKKSA
jgi:hypothetical protein